MVPIKKVEDLINKHSNLEKELSSGNVDKKLLMILQAIKKLKKLHT